MAACIVNLFDIVSDGTPPATTNGYWTRAGWNPSSSSGPWFSWPSSPPILTIPGGGTPNINSITGIIAGGNNIFASFGNATPGYYRFKYTTGEPPTCFDESFVIIEVIDQSTIPNANQTTTITTCPTGPNRSISNLLGGLSSIVTYSNNFPIGGVINDAGNLILHPPAFTPGQYWIKNTIVRVPNFDTELFGSAICSGCVYDTYVQTVNINVIPTPNATVNQTTFCYTEFGLPDQASWVDIPIQSLFNNLSTNTPIKLWNISGGNRFWAYNGAYIGYIPTTNTSEPITPFITSNTNGVYYGPATGTLRVNSQGSNTIVLGYRIGERIGNSDGCSQVGQLTITLGCPPQACLYTFSINARYITNSLFRDSLSNYYYVGLFSLAPAITLPTYIDGQNGSHVASLQSAYNILFSQNGGGQAIVTYNSATNRWTIQMYTFLVPVNITASNTQILNGAQFVPTGTPTCTPCSPLAAGPLILITNNQCPSTPGSISATCIAPSVTQYSTSPTGPWSTTPPAYLNNTSMTIYARCYNPQTDCATSVTQASTQPVICATCPTLSSAPGNVTITNSSCSSSCTNVNGLINPPAVACPANSFLEYSVNGGAWSTNLPVYNSNIVQTITTRCQCTSDNNILSPTSAPVSTAPVVCSNPTDPTIIIVDNDCPDTEGSITANCTSPGTIAEYSLNSLGPWSTTPPAYTETSFTVFARCRNTTTNCVSNVVNATTNPSYPRTYITADIWMDLSSSFVQTDKDGNQIWDGPTYSVTSVYVGGTIINPGTAVNLGSSSLGPPTMISTPNGPYVTNLPDTLNDIIDNHPSVTNLGFTYNTTRKIPPTTGKLKYMTAVFLATTPWSFTYSMPIGGFSHTTVLWDPITQSMYMYGSNSPTGPFFIVGDTPAYSAESDLFYTTTSIVCE